MVVKQTDRALIDAYAIRGVAIFDEVEVKLNDLIAETAEVLYNGMRARDFKTTCTQNAVDFGKVCSDNMVSMSEVISSAASYISTNMGADAITVELKPPTGAPAMPAIQVDESVETADDGVLNALKDTCKAVYDRIDELFTDHLNDFDNLGTDGGWIGPEYDSAMADVLDLTNLMHTGIEESATTMTSAIDKQLGDLGMA